MSGMKLALSMQLSQMPLPRLEQRLAFEQQHPLLELMAFYERAKPLSMSITDTRTGKKIEVEYVIAPRRLMDYVKEGEPYGISVADMIFVSDKTPFEAAPIVAFKLFEERFVDPGLDKTGRVKHLRAALDSVKLATALGLPPRMVADFVDALVREDSTGLIEADPLVQKYVGVRSWQVPEKAAYLDAHMANWRVVRSKSFGSMLSTYEEAQRCFRDFGISKADFILPRIAYVNPYLLGQFIRMASTMPLGMPFEVDATLSEPAYALTEEACGVGLIHFMERDKISIGRNDVMRSRSESNVESTWRSLVVRVESQLLLLERKIEEAAALLRGKISDLTLELDHGRTEPHMLAESAQFPSQEKLERMICRDFSRDELMPHAYESFKTWGQQLASMEELRKLVGR